MTLLHLRDIADRKGVDLSIVSEMLDVRNRHLAEVTRADDFIVSDRIVSLMLAQISENKALNAVFADLFDPEGSEIYLKPAGDYVALDTPVDLLHGAGGRAAAGRRWPSATGGRRRRACRSSLRRTAQSGEGRGEPLRAERSCHRPGGD